MSTLWADWETFSTVDLKREGAYCYASHPDTGIYCLGWAVDDDTVRIWVPGQPVPPAIIEHCRQRRPIYAHNAAFDRLIWEYVAANDHGFPETALTQWRCSAARARAHGLPGSLGDIARALALPIQKQPEGARLIRTYCIGPDYPAWTREDWTLFMDYCVDDVRVMRLACQVLRELTSAEWAEYHLSERINDRGVPVDLALARLATARASEVRADVDLRICELTGGKVKKATDRKNRDEWITPMLTPAQVEVLTQRKRLSFDEGHRADLLECDDLDPLVVEYLDLLGEAGGATIAKYQAMQDRSIGGRVPGAFIWNGAGQTGRFSSVGLQVQNLSRKPLENPERVIAALRAGRRLPDAAEVLKRLVRSAIYAPAKGLTYCDFRSIEGRVAPWLEGGAAGETKLQVYRDGRDPYVITAAAIARCAEDEVTKDMRQSGKVAELALQFLGGVGALNSMARAYGMPAFDQNRGEEIRDAWRALNPWAQNFGRACERAVFAAMREPGTTHAAGRISYTWDGCDWLWCLLPSGRYLAYAAPRIDWVETPWGEERTAVTVLWGSRRPKAGAKWPRRALYPGLLVENNTQAVAADLQRAALSRADRAGLAIVMHVHDELVVEGRCLPALERVMLQLPPWAKGLPIEVEGAEGARYAK